MFLKGKLKLMQNIFKGFKQLNVCFILQGFSIRGDELDDTVFLRLVQAHQRLWAIVSKNI